MFCELYKFYVVKQQYNPLDALLKSLTAFVFIQIKLIR